MDTRRRSKPVCFLGVAASRRHQSQDRPSARIPWCPNSFSGSRLPRWWRKPKAPSGLKRSLRAGDLIMLAIGAVIGAGIFGAIGTAAAGPIGPERRSDPRRRGSGAGLFLSPAGRRLRAGRAVLRRAGVHDSAGRQRLRLLLRHAGRTGGLDHRLGSDSGIRRGQRRGGDFLGRLLQYAAARIRRARCRRGSPPAIAPRCSAPMRRSTACCTPRRTFSGFRS